MRSKTTYEWVVEEMDLDPGQDILDDEADIHDTHAFPTLDEARRFARLCELPTRLVLVRDVGNQDEGITDRSWAYLDADGKLPSHFTYGQGEEGYAVPGRYRKEVAMRPR